MVAEKAGEKELENYEGFLSEYSTQLREIEDTLGDVVGESWDFALDPVTLNVSGMGSAVALSFTYVCVSISSRAMCSTDLLQQLPPLSPSLLTAQCIPHEHASWFDLIRTDHTVRLTTRITCVCLCCHVHECVCARVCVVWCGVVWCGVVWCGVVWCAVV